MFSALGRMPMLRAAHAAWQRAYHEAIIERRPFCHFPRVEGDFAQLF